MKQQTTPRPVLWKIYKIGKKLAKYACYIAVLYFAWKGFMSWD
ncbi:hypothetical protein [Chitinophaga arvensicola]|uniref:Uncharacterized protein n=1 Tax=Chitinophaga arvensicola TaxID=29529 RepID=A0A1I0RG52_9BACT|nr:hypothetical protein [Chitinophaga arvensicola]SEW39898.1 hypothetical protein SAMN04488122_2796 [Chitinophaga arvensicola]